MKKAEYTVREGDTLFDLGIKFNVPLQELTDLNGETVTAGQKIEFPLNDEVYAIYALGKSQSEPPRENGTDSKSDDEIGETYRRHKVRRGDTVFLLAKEYGTTVQNILALNPQISDVRNIQIGSIITVPVPPAGSYIYAVRPNDTLSSIASAHNTALDSIMRYNFISKGDTLYPGQQLVIVP